jgi:FixJ family two-component response regulator
MGVRPTAEPRRIAMTRDSQDDPSRPTIVVVNDDSALRHALRFALGVEGFVVRTFAKGEDLLGAADLADLACVVTDARLPDMPGLDLVARLRRQRDGLPAILLTTNPTLRLRREAEDAGVALIEKPLRGDSVVNVVVALLSGLARTDPQSRHCKV